MQKNGQKLARIKQQHDVIIFMSVTITRYFGKLYNWYTVNDPRGLVPKGYHIPSEAEWTILINFLGGESYAGTKLKANSGWDYN